MTAPAFLVRAAQTAMVRLALAYADSRVSLWRYDYRAAAADLGRAARWGMAAAALGRLVQACGGPPKDTTGGDA